MSQKNCESLVADLLAAIENGEYETFLDTPKEISFYKKWNQPTKLLSEKLLLSFLLDHALSLVNEFDDFLDTVDEMEVFEINSEDQLVLEIGNNNIVKLSEIEHVISAIQLIQSNCLELKEKILSSILYLWQENKESSVFKYEEIERVKPGAFSRLKRIALTNIEENFLHDFDSARMLNDEEDSFYVGGASYTVANLNFSGEADLSMACSSCGSNLLVCKSKNCMRSYFFFSTGIDCSLDVYGFEEGNVLLVSVSELGGRLARLLSGRIPTVIGELQLNKSRNDDQVRLLIGSSFLIDYEDHITIPSDDYETILESSVYLTHPSITEGEYLVVAWQEPWEITEDSCFMVGLYKGDARSKLEELLR
ncbi:hypothetical protein MCELANE86_00469 [Candidatus Nanopelagicaceae bacterium]